MGFSCQEFPRWPGPDCQGSLYIFSHPLPHWPLLQNSEPWNVTSFEAEVGDITWHTALSASRDGGPLPALTPDKGVPH
eukprot:4753132-Amphidinium_carterae.2